MAIEQYKRGAVIVVKPDSPAIGDEADLLKSRLLDALRQSLGRTVLDCSSMAFADSRVLEVLVEVNEELLKSGRVLKLCQVNETFEEVLKLTGLLGDFECYEEINAGVRSYL